MFITKKAILSLLFPLLIIGKCSATANSRKTKVPDVTSLRYTINELLKYQKLFEYIAQHAMNRFELVEWDMIEDMDHRKHIAIDEIRQEIPDYTQQLVLMARIFDRYRGGIYRMQQVKQQLIKDFSSKLDSVLNQAKNVKAGATNQSHLNEILNAIQQFENDFHTQYINIRSNVYRLVN